MNTTAKITLTLSAAILHSFLTTNAIADGVPFYTSNQSPLVMSYGIPAPESAKLLTAGTCSSGLFFAVSSIAINEQKGNESITLDGETYNLNFRVRYGWSDRLQLGMDIAAIRHEGGSLDGLVENWHDLFGLPNGSRNHQPDNRLLFHYARQDDLANLEFSESQSGIGDLRLSAIYQLKSTSNYQLAVRGGLKLPVGDADKLTGSDSTDISVELLASLVPELESKPIIFHYGLGILSTGDSAVLDTIKEDWVPYGYASLAWILSNRIKLQLQLNGHGSMYDSDLASLGDSAIELVMGGSATLSSRWEMDISISEDIIGSSAPDFTVLLGLRYRLQN